MQTVTMLSQPMHAAPPAETNLDDIAAQALELGHDVVDVAGFLDAVLESAKVQAERLDTARTASDTLSRTGLEMVDQSVRLCTEFTDLSARMTATSDQLKVAMQGNQQVIGRIVTFSERLATIDAAMVEAERSNQHILRIAKEVNILAINARIEATRAGAAGSGFAVIAEAVNRLSGETERAARNVTDTFHSLGRVLRDLQVETDETSQEASQSLARTTDAEAALGQVNRDTVIFVSDLEGLRDGTDRMRGEVTTFGHTFHSLAESVVDQLHQLREARDRTSSLTSQSESLIQDIYALGGRTSDRAQIEDVQAAARELSQRLEAAVDKGDITMAALFSEQYQPVTGTDPQQVIAPFTALTDRLFPQVQEAMLAQHSGAVFCAAVDRNGYLPTHNTKFSHPQGNDPVWNMANCRNRRIFDDRVGLGAGRSERPFLMQVYRRDMGGGVFRMMKDVSAPIRVRGRHWGGLRLAYDF
jgi:methyl-accepting chemotaxis protein